MSRRSKTEAGRSSGVTLLELLVVAAIAGVLLALVFPSIRAGMATMELRTTAQRLAAAAKFARDQAIYRQRPFQLEINGEKRTIAVMDSGGESRSFEIPAGIRVGKILPPEPDDASPVRSFLFSPDGSSTPFQIVLESPRRRVEVTTDPLTGFPKILEMPNSSQL